MELIIALLTQKVHICKIAAVIAFFLTIVSFLVFFEYNNSIGLQAKANIINQNKGGQINTSSSNIESTGQQKLDRFEVKEVYDTKRGGREWYVDMANPYSDPWFILDSVNLERQSDGSWRLGGTDMDRQYNDEYHIILGVNTPPWEKEWQDVEITGYAKIVEASEDEDEEEVGLQWYARGGNHTNEYPCQGTSLKARILADGNANWKKEIWHHDGDGYTEERDTKQVTDQSIMNRWFGWKVVMYNVENNTAVKMESYIDNENNNTWIKVNDFIDKGDWFASTSDDDFDDVNCGRPKDYIVTNSGPVASFRSDGVVWDFKYLSVREIQPPLPPPSSP